MGGEGWGCDNVEGETGQAGKWGMKTSEWGRGEGCKAAADEFYQLFLMASSSFTAWILLYWGWKNEWHWRGWVNSCSGFFPFLQQQETQKIFLNKAWNWLFVFCLWNFLWLTNWTLIPSLPGKADALAATRQKSQMKPAERGSVSPAQSFINFKVFCESWCSLIAWCLTGVTEENPSEPAPCAVCWRRVCTAVWEMVGLKSSWHLHTDPEETGRAWCPRRSDYTEERREGCKPSKYVFILISKGFPECCRERGWKGNQDIIPCPKGTSELSLLSGICLSCTQSLPEWGFYTLLGHLFWCLTTLAVRKFILVSSLNFLGCNLSPLLLVLSNMETKFILLSAQLFLKTSIFQKMCVELSLQGGAGTQTLLPENAGHLPACQDSLFLKVIDICTPTPELGWFFCAGLVRLTDTV